MLWITVLITAVHFIVQGIRAQRTLGVVMNFHKKITARSDLLSHSLMSGGDTNLHVHTSTDIKRNNLCMHTSYRACPKMSSSLANPCLKSLAMDLTQSQIIDYP